MDRRLFKKVVSPMGYITVEPKPTPEELKDYYQKLYYQSEEAIENTGYERRYSDEEISFRNLHSDLILYSLERAASSTRKPHSESFKPKFLEIGCGEGFLLHSAFQRGWDVQGLDFSSYAIEKFNPHLVEHVSFGDVYEILRQDMHGDIFQFDFCVMQNVLEHVIDPSLLLNNLKNMMRPGSLIMFIVPNDYSVLQIRSLALGLIDSETWWAPPDHLNYFNIENGAKFAQALGFKVKDIFSTFPVDFFLFHSGSNYYRDRNLGKEAHHARIKIELLLAEAGIAKYHSFCQALAGCNVGRNFALVLGM